MADIELGDIPMPRPRRRRRREREPSEAELAAERAIVDDVEADVFGGDDEISTPTQVDSPSSTSGSPASGLDLRLDEPTMRPTPLLRRMAREESERRIASQPISPAVIDEEDESEENLFGANQTPSRPAEIRGPSPSIRGGAIAPEETIEDDLDEGRSTATVVDPNAPGQMAKGRFRPDVADFTAKERERLERAEGQDRRRNITRGVAGGLGLLAGIAGAATGNYGLAGLGEMAAGASSAAPGRRNAVMGDIEARRASETAANERFDTAERHAQASEAQRAEQEIEARRAEASARLDEARAQGLISENERATQQAAIDERARQANIEAARAGLRARVGVIEHSPNRASWEANLPGMLASEDPDQLLRQQAFVGATDVHRGGQGPGGSGGGSRETTSFNPATGQYETRSVRTGPRSAVATPSDGAPSRISGGPAMPAPLEGPVDESTEVAWAERVMNSAGWTDRDRREGVIRRLRTGRGNAAHDTALGEMTDLAGRTERTRERGVAPGLVDVPEADIQRMEQFARTQMTPVVANRRRALNLMSSIRRWRQESPIALRAAIETQRNPESASNFSPDVLAQAQDITRQFSAYVNPMLSERSGAAVTNSEMNRALRELGLSSAMGDLGALERAFDAQVTDWENLIQDRAADLHPAFVQQWARAHGFGGE